MKTLVVSKQYQILAKDEELWIVVTNMQLKPMKIAKFIGTPTCAIISQDEKFAIIGGYGLMLINLNDFLYNSEHGKKQEAISIHLRSKSQRYWIDNIWLDKKSEENIIHFQSQLVEHAFNFKNKQLINIDTTQNTNSKELVLV